jgi:hypothetical protein
MGKMPKLSVDINKDYEKKIRKVYKKYLSQPLVVNGHTFKFGPNQTIVRAD